MNAEKSLRHWLAWLLAGGNAHVSFDDAFRGMPAKLRGVNPPCLQHTAWQLLEHMRLAQGDILDFSRNPKYQELAFPEGYWPKTEVPPAGSWERSIRLFRADLATMRKLVSNPKTDLHARIPWGDGQTILREALLLADHNSYHLGQLILVRKSLGAWKG